MLNEEELNYLKQIYKGRYVKDVTKMINEKFNANHTCKEIENYKRTRGLRSGIDSTFKKGHIPYNAGTKGLCKANRGSFKKRNRPAKYLPIGSEVKKRGYWMVKVGEPSVWKMKNRLIWEERFGEIPEGYRVTFIDGNSDNFNLDNLALISDNENKLLNQMKLRKEDVELTRAGIGLVKVISKINERKKELK